ncbi:MAG: AT hook motif protein [Elusimicrobia bacterium]|nr:AT hook motif protein [Elusimicrobiota bacterium]
MSKIKEFPFSRAHRVTNQELEIARKAIEAKLGIKRHTRGRPPKGLDKYEPIQIRLHPKALHWAKLEAKHRGIGYQTVINQALLTAAT